MIRWLSLYLCLGTACVQMPELQTCEDDVPCPEAQQVCHDGWCLDPTPTGDSQRIDGGSQITDARLPTDASQSLDSGVHDTGAQINTDAGGITRDAGTPHIDGGSPSPELCWSALFNGMSGHISLSENQVNPFSLTTEITLSVWVKVPNAAHGSARWIFDLENHLVESGRTGTYVAYGAALGLTATGKVTFGIFDGERNWSITKLESEAVIPSGEWVHLLASGTAQTLSLRVNGSLAGTLGLPEGQTIGFHRNGSRDYVVGRHAQPIAGSHQYFEGKMSGLAIWNRPLTPAEVREVTAQRMEGTLLNGLQGHWPMNEVDGAEVSDRTNNHPGQLRGGVSWASDCPEPIELAFPRDCQELKSNYPDTTTGIYLLDPDGVESEEAYDAHCDMNTAGGGWTRAVSVERNSPLWNAGTARWQWEHAQDPSATYGLGFDRFSDAQSGEDLEFLFATFDGVTETFHTPLFREVHLAAWDPSRVGGVFDDSFEYRELGGVRWRTCAEAALNRAIARHNWVITGDPDQACSSSVGTHGGMGFLLSGLAGSEEIGAKLSGLGEFNGDDNFSFLRIYTRRR